MAQCYARDAMNSGLEDAIERLKVYREEAGVDWVQLESSHSIEEIKLARAEVKGPFSFMKGKLPRYLSLDEHQQLGVHIAWFPGFTHHVLWAAMWDFMRDFQSRGVAAWEDFQEQCKGKPYPDPSVGIDGEGAAKQEALEKRYFGRS
jgi:2-methylisocitrate lyase-like PEP mutase family enzyme